MTSFDPPLSDSGPPSAPAGGEGTLPAGRTVAEPQVLVVTPSLNQARYLREAVESVLAQNHPRLDYFVADGGSTDGSVEILRGYGDRLRWVSRPDDGQAAAVADAWERSDAEILGWLNSDDCYLPRAVSRAVTQFAASPTAGLIYGNAWFIDEHGEKLRAYPTRPFDERTLRNECFICQPAAFVRRSVFERVDYPDRALRYCMDYDLWIRLSREFPALHLDDYLACSRLHAETKSQRELTAMFAEIERVTARAYGVAPRNWAVASMIHRSKLRVKRAFGFLPARLRNRLQAAMVRRVEALYRGPLFSDLWAGTATTVEVRPDPAGRVSLRGESPYWPYAEPLAIAVELAGETLARQSVAERGAFVLEFELPPALRGAGASVEVLLRASRTFVPQVHGYAPWDERPVAFMVR